MGVTRLLPYLRKTCPHVFSKVHILDYAGKTLALDGSLMVFRLFKGTSDSRTALQAWHDILRALRHNGVGAICMFDGPGRPKQKFLETARRMRTRQQAVERVGIEREVHRQLSALQEAATLPEEAKSTALRSGLQSLRDALEPIPPQLPTAMHRDHRELVRFVEPLIAQPSTAQEESLPLLTDELVRRGYESETRQARFQRQAQPFPSELMTACMDMAEACGVPVYSPPLEVPREGEELACAFVNHSLASAVASYDTDCLVYGAPLLVGIEQLAFPQDARHSISLIDPYNIQLALELDRAAWVDFCILCGTDYPGHLPGIGPINALKLLKRHGNIEGVVKALRASNSRHMADVEDDLYLEDVVAVRRLFLEQAPPPEIELDEGGVHEVEVDALLDLFPAQLPADA